MLYLIIFILIKDCYLIHFDKKLQSTAFNNLNFKMNVSKDSHSEIPKSSATHIIFFLISKLLEANVYNKLKTVLNKFDSIGYIEMKN